MNALFLEKQNIKLAHLPVDLNTAAITGERIKVATGDKVAIVAAFGDSTSATAVQYTLRQHNAASSGTSKDLTSANPYFYKKGAETSFTKVTPSSAAALVDVTTQFASDEGVLVIEVLGEQLDVKNGFFWLSVDIADAGAAKLGSTMYVLQDVRNAPAYSTAL